MESSRTAGRLQPVIRPYQAGDREAVRRICADTGFLGKPIDPVFEDRELFADYLTGYYTDREPDSIFVCVQEGEVKGYLMGCLDPKRKARFEARMMPGLVLRGLWRYFMRPYGPASRRYVRWILMQARHEVPFSPPNMAHMHFNILPEARNVLSLRELMDMFLTHLTSKGVPQVYGQVVSHGSRRGERMFGRYGFQLVDQREVTKYREFYPGKVLLLTVIKDLSAHPTIYGLDLHKAKRAEKPLPGDEMA